MNSAARHQGTRFVPQAQHQLEVLALVVVAWWHRATMGGPMGTMGLVEELETGFIIAGPPPPTSRPNAFSRCRSGTSSGL